MVKLVYAKSEDAIRNGSFILQRHGPRTSVLVQYMNGDRMGEVHSLPDGLKTWQWKDAAELIPRSIK